MATDSSVREHRKALNLTQLELARRAGVSRQALSAIEAGIYQPTVGVALRLASELGQRVERLFGGPEPDGQCLEARWYELAPRSVGPPSARVTLGRVRGRVVAVPQKAAGLWLNPPAGMVARLKGNRATIATYSSSEELDATLLIAGCDPAASLMADWMTRRHSPARLVPLFCSSSRALDALANGCAHCAGVHLKDPRTGEFNLQSVRRVLRRRRAIVVTFARWEQGVAVRAGNRLGFSSLADLGRAGVRIANREKGSGARAILDSGLKRAGIRPNGVAGYHSEFGGHLEVANAVAAGQADAGVTVRVAADAYGLAFVPLQEERYDLVILEADADTPPIRAMLDTLGSRRFAREISQFCGYDTETMGDVVARVNTQAA